MCRRWHYLSDRNFSSAIASRCSTPSLSVPSNVRTECRSLRAFSRERMAVFWASVILAVSTVMPSAPIADAWAIRLAVGVIPPNRAILKQASLSLSLMSCGDRGHIIWGQRGCCATSPTRRGIWKDGQEHGSHTAVHRTTLHALVGGASERCSHAYRTERG